MYLSWGMAFIVIVAVITLLHYWKGIHLKRLGFLGIFIVFLVYAARYHNPVRDHLYHIVELLLLGLGTFLLALSTERRSKPGGE